MRMHLILMIILFGFNQGLCSTTEERQNAWSPVQNTETIYNHNIFGQLRTNHQIEPLYSDIPATSHNINNNKDLPLKDYRLFYPEVSNSIPDRTNYQLKYLNSNENKNIQSSSLRGNDGNSKKLQVESFAPIDENVKYQSLPALPERYSLQSDTQYQYDPLVRQQYYMVPQTTFTNGHSAPNYLYYHPVNTPYQKPVQQYNYVPENSQYTYDISSGYIIPTVTNGLNRNQYYNTYSNVHHTQQVPNTEYYNRGSWNNQRVTTDSSQYYMHYPTQDVTVNTHLRNNYKFTTPNTFYYN